MHTGQNSIAPENSLPQLGQVRWGSVLMGQPFLRMRLKLKEHGFPRQTAAARLGKRMGLSEKRYAPTWFRFTWRSQLRPLPRQFLRPTGDNTVANSGMPDHYTLVLKEQSLVHSLPTWTRKSASPTAQPGPFLLRTHGGLYCTVDFRSSALRDPA
jgi:hypothetical protein